MTLQIFGISVYKCLKRVGISWGRQDLVGIGRYFIVLNTRYPSPTSLLTTFDQQAFQLKQQTNKNRSVPDLSISNLARAGSSRFRNPNQAAAGFGDNSFSGSQNNTSDETNAVNNAFSCYRGSTVQCFLCYVTDC